MLQNKDIYHLELTPDNIVVIDTTAAQVAE